MDPQELLYAKTHEWVHVDSSGSDKLVTIGISAFAVEALTDLVFLELPEVGKSFDAGTVFGEVESVKAVSDLYAPVALEVTEVNSELPDNLDRLSEDPFGAGWVVKGKLADEAGLGQLMDYATYQKQCEEEGH